MQNSSILPSAGTLLLTVGALSCGGAQSSPEAPAGATSAVAPVASSPAASQSAQAASPAPAASGAPAAPAASAEPPSEHKEIHWAYTSEEGPQHWGDLKQEYATCKSGAKQAPIDLPKTAAKSKDLKSVSVSYKPIPVKIINNGHTVQVNNTAPASIQIGTEKFELVQMHMHSPSEHTVANKSFDAELHLVHKNAKGELAVVGVLFNKGKENKALAPFFANAPTSVTTEDAPVAGAAIDGPSLLPAKGAYYTYPGSLTTPPCTEGVTWLVLEKPSELSEAQLSKLQGALHGANNRPVQPLNERAVGEVK